LIGVKPCTKSVILKSEIKVCVLWLSRYFCYSIETKRVEFTRTGGDRSFSVMFTCVLIVLLYLKESKEKKQIMKREDYGKNKDKNIEDKVFMIFNFISKTK